MPAVPYAPATAFLAAEKAKLDRPRRRAAAGRGDRRRDRRHARRHPHDRADPRARRPRLRGRGDRHRRRRRPPPSAAAELEVPFYEGLRLGVPGLPDLVETLAEGRYDLLHVTAPGPAGVAATLLSRISGLPLIGSYHTELAAYAGLRSGDGGLEAIAATALGVFYAAPSVVLSPSPAADRSLLGLGADPARLGRWERGVDT